jgi:hypothetical protein
MRLEPGKNLDSSTNLYQLYTDKIMNRDAMFTTVWHDRPILLPIELLHYLTKIGIEGLIIAD